VTRFLALVVTGLALVTAAACGDVTPAARVVELVVPAGTQERLDRGEAVVVMPARLEVRVGDRIVIRNEDSVEQSVGPYSVAAGQTFELTWGAPGSYSGYCPLSEGERYEIVVTA
jgi:plastocyanin